MDISCQTIVGRYFYWFVTLFFFKEKENKIVKPPRATKKLKEKKQIL